MTRRSAIAILSVVGASARTKPVEVRVAFRSPGPAPNGLQAVHEGLWVLDQGDNTASLLSYSDGKVLRSIRTEAKAGSGITFDGLDLWISSTYSCEILRVDARTGRTLARFPCPGAGPVKWTRQRLSPLLQPARPAPIVDLPLTTAPEPSGSHGLEWRDGSLYIAVPPARRIYCVDPEGFREESSFASAGDRPHGLGWQGGRLWCAESNDNAFYRFQMPIGRWDRKIQLGDNDPLPHGMTIRGRVLWYCDDVGVICRLSLS